MKSDFIAYFKKHTLIFKQPAGTSRGVLKTKDSWIIHIYDKENPEKTGKGECSPLKGLSIDDREDYEQKVDEVCKNINNFNSFLKNGLNDFPSIRFGLEMALKDIEIEGENIIFPSEFTQGKDSIEINGLIWMGEFDFMRKQIIEKIEAGFSCIKVKIGAINFDKEIELIKSIRKEFTEKDIEIRVDANGAFAVDEALEKLKILSEYDLHSIEQPIKQGQWEEMTSLCAQTPLPIALDEELIGVIKFDEKITLLQTIKPQYIILKPSLTGGFEASEEWIKIAEQNDIGWWITSALESNIGLNAIAQWAYALGNKMPQGLGTGELFKNNFDSPLYIKTGQLNFFYSVVSS